ncbi:MAG TPA: hypothetical protein PKD49_04240 [Hyphomicrobium sp.]|nr:hypothetical protein [Hyphomicrobium sp.]
MGIGLPLSSNVSLADQMLPVPAPPHHYLDDRTRQGGVQAIGLYKTNARFFWMLGVDEKNDQVKKNDRSVCWLALWRGGLKSFAYIGAGRRSGAPRYLVM